MVWAGAFILCKATEGAGTGLPGKDTFGEEGTSNSHAVFPQYLGEICEKVELACNTVCLELKRKWAEIEVRELSLETGKPFSQRR